jgi:sucrose-phosphate synthase
MSNRNQDGLYFAMISVHGLHRGHDMELGRDADTGGQTKYVVEVAQALARTRGGRRGPIHPPGGGPGGG